MDVILFFPYSRVWCLLRCPRADLLESRGTCALSVIRNETWTMLEGCVAVEEVISRLLLRRTLLLAFCPVLSYARRPYNAMRSKLRATVNQGSVGND